MQYVKARKDLLYGFNPLLFLIGILIFFFLPTLILNVFYIFWIALACAIMLIVTPLGNRRLAHDLDDSITRLPVQQWLFGIFILEITMIGVYWGICLLNGKLFLINTTAHTQLFQQAIKAGLLHSGLFPWSLYAVIAAGMGVLAYAKQKNAYFSELLKPFSKQEPAGSISLILNIGAKRITLFAISVTLLLMTLLLISFVLPLNTHVAHNFQPAALLTTLILLFAVFSQFFKRYVAHAFSRHVPTSLNFPMFCVVLGFTLLLLSASTESMTNATAAQATPHFIEHWIAYHWHTAWLIFSVMWWTCFTPLFCGFVARISRGYRVRELIMAVLFLPVIVTLLLLFAKQSWLSSIHFSDATIQLISLLCFIILLPLLVNHSTSANAILAYLPKNGETKPRDHHPFFLKIAQYTIVALYFYLTIGMNGLSVFLFAPCFLIVPILMVVAVAIVENHA